MTRKKKPAQLQFMCALSMTQPWATLASVSAKKIETRSWSTNYRGPLAIHASKIYPLSAKGLTLLTPFYEALDKAGLMPATLPTGSIIAYCVLKDVIKIEAKTKLPKEPERSFGDYTIGRYMWILEDMQPLKNPIPARGRLGLWTWRNNGG